MDTVFQDVRYGFRMLRKNPVFTVVATLTLALGIGANTAIFSVVNAVLFRPLPFAEPDRVVAVFESNPAKGFDRFSASPPNFMDWRDQNHVFSGMAAYVPNPMALTGRGEAARLKTVLATPDLFPVLGVSPFLGRAFATEEGQRGHDHVAVLSHRLWQERFGGDRSVIGQTIRLDGENYEIVGVMPAEFQFPISVADLWVPLSFRENVATQRGAHYLGVVARMKPGVSVAQASEELKRIHAGLAAAYPDKDKGWTAFANDYRTAVVGNVRPALLILLGAVALVVLIACTNIANLLLARAGDRDREVAIRTALGAAPGRLIRQLLTESLLLSLLGAAAGLVVAYWAIAVILAYGPQDIPRIHSVQVDAHVLEFTAALAVVTGLIFGLLPAWRASKPNVNQSLKSGPRTVGRHEGKWLRSSLVAGELALSLALLAGAGLLLRSFAKLQGVDPGFTPSHVLTFNLTLPEASYPDGNRTAAFYDDLLQRIQSLPGVRSSAVTSIRPFSGDDFSSSFVVTGAPPEPPGEERSAQLRVVTRDYFTTLQIPLLRGRPFQAGDRRDSPQVVLLSRSAERKFFPNGDALGKEMRFGARMGFDKLKGEVIGVVGDVHDFGLDTEPPLDAYLLADQSGIADLSVVVRSAGDPASLASAVRDQVHAVDKDLPITQMSTMDDVMAESLAERRFYMLLLGIFAAIALTLAAVGVYGAMAYSVSRRTQEIGIRLALGARHKQVLAMVLSRAALLVGIGLGAGLIATAAASRILAGLLFGISATDPLILAAVTVALALVAMLAGYLPARRVLRVDPMVALHYE
jgi:putative ABC transport system permease protein